jgi:hypothetical protein
MDLLPRPSRHSFSPSGASASPPDSYAEADSSPRADPNSSAELSAKPRADP